MNNSEAFEAWWDGRQLPENMKAAFFMVWQAAIASQEPTLKNNEFIPDSIEGRIQAAIKCLNMHWVSHDANRFDYAIEGLEKCLSGLASQAQQDHLRDTTKMMQPITSTDSAREYLVENLLPKFSDSTFSVYVRSALAGDFAYQLAMYLQSQAQQTESNQGCKECDGQTYIHSQTGEYLGECPYCTKEEEPYAYDVPTEDGTELAYAIYFTKYNNPLPEGAIPLYVIPPAPDGDKNS